MRALDEARSTAIRTATGTAVGAAAGIALMVGGTRQSLRTVRAAGERLLARADHAADVLVPAIVGNLVRRVDLTQLVQDNIQLDRLAKQVITDVDLSGLIRQSSTAVTSDAVRGVRMQTIEADEAITRMVDRVLLRKRAR